MRLRYNPESHTWIHIRQIVETKWNWTCRTSFWWWEKCKEEKKLQINIWLRSNVVQKAWQTTTEVDLGFDGKYCQRAIYERC